MSVTPTYFFPSAGTKRGKQGNTAGGSGGERKRMHPTLENGHISVRAQKDNYPGK